MDRIYKALSDSTRREIIRLLRQREMTAGEIASHFSLSKPTLTGHFAVLREAGLIQGEKSGTSITYSLQLSVLEDALALLMDQFRIGQPRTRPATTPKVTS